jgi:hypothetical protein
MAIVNTATRVTGIRAPPQGIMYFVRILLILFVLAIIFLREGAVMDTATISSGLEDGTLGGAPKYSCSANVQDYFVPFETVCNENTAILPKPIWTPGFPGSGATLFRTIVETMTGLATDSTYFENNPRPPATCIGFAPIRITDCPLSSNCPGPINPKALKTNQVIVHHESSIMLVRNPQFAIPSYLNKEWEKENPALSQKQPQAPEPWWNTKRNEQMEDLLRQWERSIVQWTSREADLFPPVSLVVSYERLTSPHYGPHVLERMVKELRNANSPVRVVFANATISNPEIYHCLWSLLVAEKEDIIQSSSKRTYQPGYTKEEQAQLLEMVEHVIHEELDTDPKDPQQHEHRSDLLSILTDYRKDLNKNVRIVS